MDWQNSMENDSNTHGRLSFLLGAVFSRVNLSLVVAFAILTSTVAPVALATKLADAKYTKVPAKLATNAQSGETVTFYGPRRFERLTGSPVTVSEQFSIPAGVNPPYTIQIQNGAPDGTHRVSSATIHLNGVELFTQNAIKDSTPSLSQTVTLQSLNMLQVKLTSAVGSFLTITFTGVRNLLPASLVTVNPTRATQGQSLTVALQGQNTHWVQGQTRASFGPEVSVNGAAAGELGTVTVSSFTTATAQITVSSTAALSPRNVRVLTPNVPAPFPLNFIEESVSLTDAFTVVATSPPGPSSTTVTTIAGLAGNPGFADGEAAQARFNNPAGLSVGLDESLYIADAGNNRIRFVRLQLGQSGNPQWVVSTLAGDGTYGFADGPAATAQFKNPQGVAVDSVGVVFVADTSNNRIRRIALDGTVTTVAGDGTAGLVDGPGNQARFNSPRGIAVDQQGNIYVADTGNAAVRLINPGGQVSTIAGDGTIGSTDSPPRFDCPSGVAVNGSTVYVYLADKGNHRIRRLDSTGSVITLAGQGRGFADGSPTDARFAEPSGITIDGSGKILVTDAVNSLIRQVDPTLAASGSPNAVSTLAGSGERGNADGNGGVAGFLTPRGIASTTSSAIIVSDTGNHTLRRLLLPPVITAVTPTQGHTADTITITGERFDGRAPDRNTVRFARSAESGGGQTTAVVTSATQTELVVVVPDDAATGLVSVQTEGGTAVSADNFVVLPNPPVIASFSPQSGPVGTIVTLTGTRFKVASGTTRVTFAGDGATRLPALISSISSTEVRANVPMGAVTGTIELTTPNGTAVTNGNFTVELSQDFEVTAAPSAIPAIERGSGTCIIHVTSAQPTFTQLAQLSAVGLPAGVQAKFDAPQITAGATSTLSLLLANSTVGPGSYSFTVRAAASIDGREHIHTATATLNVIAAGQTTLSGRVLSTSSEPVVGATVSLDGRTSTTDAAGAFLLSGVTAGTNRPVMVDGRTASAPNRTYPVILEPATVIAGQANVVPFIFYLPPIDIQYEVELIAGQNTVATNPRVPGLQMTVPAGANLRNRDGSPVARVSITPLAIDRTPSPLPANVSTALVYTSQPGGAIADIAMPVVYPNTLGADPGTRIELYAFNHDTVQWYIYGFGRVSSDGRTISPEIDPATGRPYGLRDFSWHFPNAAGPDGNPNDKDCDNRGNAPVDYSTGIKVETMVDIAFGGARGGLTLSRTYTSDLARRQFVGRFGVGIKDNFDIRLTGTFLSGGAGRYVTAEQLSGRLFSHTSTEADGTLVFANPTTASQQGATIRKLVSGALEFRDKSGVLMKFDSNGRITSIADRNGNTTTYNYTGANLTSVTDAVNRSIVLTYSGSLVSQVTDPLGRITRYGYDGQGRLVTVTDPAGGVTTYTYDTSGFFGTNHLLSITDPRGNRVKEITYDGNGRVIAQLFANGALERYSYTLTGGRVTSTTITDALGRTEVKRFNANGYTIGSIDPMGQVSTTERDLATNLPLSRTGPCGCPETSTTYDAKGNVTATTDRLNQTTRFEYHPVFNTITRVIDALTKETVMDYDERGNLAFIRNALNQTTKYRYDSFGQLTEVIDPLDHKMRFEYDEFGNIKAIIDPLDHRTEYEYDKVGRLTTIIDPLGRHTTNQYDQLDRIISATDSAGDPTYFTYDRNGNLTAITNSFGKKWTNFFDDSNRVVLRTDPLGRQVRTKYNVGDEVISMLLPSGRLTTYQYDQRGQLASITDSMGNAVKFAYDNRGNLTSLTDQRGNTTTYTYDELFRPKTRRDPLGQVMSLSYNAMGNVREASDRMGRHVVIDYDDLHRPSIISFADATVNYTYDAAGRPKRIDDSQSGSIDWIYDDANRLVSETTPAGVVTYGYNDANQRTSMLAAGSAQVNYGYDAAGRVETITQGSEVFTYSYDALSRLSAIQRPNGVRTAYAYDAVERLSRLSHTNSAGQTIEDYRYSYNAEDQIASITSITSGQLLPNARSSGQADAGNRVAQSGAANFQFDPEGQTTSKSEPQGSTSYRWDARGRLTQVQLPDGQAVSYGYDAIGRLSSRTSGGSTTSYLYDRLDVIRDTGSEGSRIDYLNGPGTDKKLRQFTAGESSYFLQDHLGSTIAMTDAGGNVLERHNYEPFGAGTPSSRTRFGYTGRERDPSTGLLHYRARWQDPEQGRFLTEDPIGYSGGGNVYAYVGNNPLTFVDPLGLSWQTFLEGLLVGGLESLLYGAIFAVIFSALTAATAGTALAVIPPALSLLLTAGAAISVAEQIAALLTEDMCPDEWHYRAGVLIASAALMIMGGAKSRRGSKPETGPTTPYKRSDYKNPSPSRRREVLDKNPICAYCGNKKSTDFEHIKSNKQDYQEGGYKEPRDVRSDRQNSDPNNTGACKSCNSQKGAKELGPGPGQYWPPNWPAGTWWPFGGGPPP